MHIKKRIAVAVAALMPMVSLAKNIEGTIVNQLGEPISGASIQVEGTDKTAMTNEQGVFSISNLAVGENKLHIIAKGFAHSHQHVDVPETGISQYQVTLARSPIEVIDVVSSPVHLSVMESTIPVNVIAGETLRQQQADTLGDSLEKLPGVNTNFHANVASTPIIRGLSGPRVLIAQNGLDVGDVSRVGPDHSVATEAATAQQIEVFRGPATLFYGSGAIGGVVNVVDGRIPTDNTTRGEWQIQTSSVNQQKQGAFNLTSGTDSVAVYADAFWRDSKDYKVPVDEGRIANSAEESKGFTLGTSYLLDNGYFGVSVEKFNREYGIPGHSHGDEADAEQVYADLDQTRIQFLSEINLSNPVFNQLNLRASNSDYEHAEIEAGSVGTLFENSTQEFQLELQHNPFFDWKGGLNFHYKNSEISAVGSEAFTPPSTAETFAMAILEEKHIGDVLYQVGARVEQVSISSDQVLLPDLALHSHAEAEHEEDAHDHDHNEHQAGDTRVFDIEHTFSPISFSAGLVWGFLPDYNLGVSLSRSQRAPSASELMSFGPHIGTRSYEIGALFEIHQESDSAEFELNKQPIELETSKNIDFTLRKTQGDVGFVFNLFYNQVDNYYYQNSTGLFAEVTHEHASESTDTDEHDHDHDHDHASELPVYTAQINDVVLHGFEAQIAWQLMDEFKTSLFSDYVRAKLKDGGDLPRTPPLRLGAQFSYQNEKLSAQLHITRYQKQDKISAFETTTPGYTLMDANLAYDLNWFNLDTSVYLKVSNLTNTEARVHASFLKDLAPRPGRNFTAGIRGYF